jgi:ribosome-associated translation inhibitor RaiA
MLAQLTCWGSHPARQIVPGMKCFFPDGSDAILDGDEEPIRVAAPHYFPTRTAAAWGLGTRPHHPIMDGFMKIQVNTDRNIQSSQQLKDEIRDFVSGAIGRFGDRLTRVEVHLSDNNSAAKGGGNDLRCVLEARAAGHSPTTVRHDADTLDRAVKGAVDKLETALQRQFDRISRARGRTSYGGAETA